MLSRPLLFFIGGGHHPPTFQVMRRRFQRTKHTDCTAQTIFGRRNRYPFAAPMAMETFGGIYDPALKAPESGNDRAFPLYRPAMVRLSRKEYNAHRRNRVYYAPLTAKIGKRVCRLVSKSARHFSCTDLFRT